MGRPVQIAPSILAADFGRLADEIAAVERGGADSIHVDVMDGHFVPNITIGPLIVEAARAATSLPLDVHLMIERPERYLAEFANAGASGLTVHVEACPHLHRVVQQIKELGLRAGVAINPATPAQAVEPILADVDLLLAMTVNPGFGGQKFIASVLPKVDRIRRWLDERGLSADLEVDGGVNPRTAAQVAAAGANVLVAGSAIFASPDYAETIATLRGNAAHATS